MAPDHVAANEYFSKEKVRVDWQFMLVLSILLGALISSATDRSFKLESVPPIWEKRFGPSIGKRAAAAFLGGIVAMVGARMADGCPSGHGLSGRQPAASALRKLIPRKDRMPFTPSPRSQTSTQKPLDSLDSLGEISSMPACARPSRAAAGGCATIHYRRDHAGQRGTAYARG